MCADRLLMKSIQIPVAESCSQNSRQTRQDPASFSSNSRNDSRVSR